MIPGGLGELVARYFDNRDAYRSAGYNETQLRREFIDPFFRLLGWDVDNSSGYAEPYKDVIHEDSIKVAGEPKAPDYCFRIGGARKFFVEAKRPSIDVTKDAAGAYQVRRYAWSSKLPLSVLTNFESFIVYDCRFEPKAADAAAVARVLVVPAAEFVERWDEISGVFGRESILRGAFDRFAASNITKRGTTPVDKAFLAELDRWRESLARNIALRNKSLTVAELNFAVQQTIDRIVFLRMAEDRGTEPYGQLRGLLGTTAVYEGLARLFIAADQRYNSGLFHFGKEAGRASHDELSMTLTIDDKPLKEILRRLYYPESPYEFSAIPAALLGHVYEQFLGKVILLDARHRASIETRPEVRKAGGVFYTPADIVDEILRLTLDRWLEGRDVTDPRLGGPRRGERLGILDPACGSGSFLIAAYQRLLEWYLLGYSRDPERWLRGRTPRLVYSARGELRLSTAERKRILVDHVFGVDIDGQAVEVAKLSLLLKVLEGETGESIAAQLSFFRDRALPDLDANIRCGNSLVGVDAYAATADPYKARALNPFSWEEAFGRVKRGRGFEVVVGNPPWLMAGYYLDDYGLSYLRQRYASASGKFDLYYTFLERSLDLLSEDGTIGMIVPNKFVHTRSASQLRSLLASSQCVDLILDFEDAQVFERATNYAAIVVLSTRPRHSVTVARVDRSMRRLAEFNVGFDALDAKPWRLQNADEAELFDRMRTAGTPFEVLVERFGTGAQTGADTVYMLPAERAAALGLEPELLRPIRRGRDVRRYHAETPGRVVVFPYAEVDGRWRLLDEGELSSFPAVAAWLGEYRTQLAKRVWFGKAAAELSGGWYGLMYLDERVWFERPHLLTPSLASGTNFARGDGALFVTGTAGVTSAVLRDPSEVHCFALMAVLNSKLLSYYARRHSPVFQGGYHKFSAPYLKELPIALGDKRLADLGVTRESLGREFAHARTPADRESARREMRAVDEAIDTLVYSLYGLTEAQIELVDGPEPANQFIAVDTES